MRRERLAGPLRMVGEIRAGLVVAPAGAGKTTLLAAVAQEAAGPVAWLTLDERIGELDPFLDHLRAAIRAALASGRPEPPSAPERTDGGWAGIEQAIAELEGLPEDLLVVLDDLHTIQGQPAEAAVQALLDYLPPRARVLLAARWRPDLDLHRLRLAGQIRELGTEELRFRAWEIEELFRDCHGVLLRPDEVTTLARGTAGWAAGLQLFHLATRGRPASDRAKILSGLGGTRLIRDYLTSHVLSSVAQADREFLIQTSVFDRLVEHRCDELLGRPGSGARLAELERRGLFTFADDDGSGYRYHEVLRVHLLERLVAEHGEPHARAAHRAAARLCERDGALTEALLSYSRSGDWDQVRRLLSTGGRHLADDPADWFAQLPASIRDGDPWVLLAMARGLVANGSLEAAAGVYRDAVAAFGARPPDWVGSELAGLDDWLAPAPRRATAWTHALRAALVDPEPLVEGPVDTPSDLFVRAVAAFVAGEIALAEHRFTKIAAGIGASPAIEAMAAVGRAACALLGGSTRLGDPGRPGDRGGWLASDDGVLDDAVATAEALGYPAVLRVAAAVRSVRLPVGGRHVLHLLETAGAAGDHWGSAVIALFAALGALGRPDGAIAPAAGYPAPPQPRFGGDPTGPPRGRTGPLDGAAAATRDRTAFEHIARSLDQAAATFERLAAPALATWARAASLLAWRRAGTPRAPGDADRIVRAAGRLGPAPHALALVGATPPPSQGAEAGATRAGATVGRRHPYEVARLIGADTGVGPWVNGLVAAVAPVSGPVGPAREPARGGAPAPAREAATTADPDGGTVRRAPDKPVGTDDGGGGRLTVRCLGGFEVALDGRLVDLAAVAPRNLEVLQVLAVSAGQPVHRDRLAALVWPEAEPARAHHSLQVAVSALRKLVDGQPRRVGQGYQLVLTDPDDLDVRRLDRLLDAAAMARRAGDGRAEHDHLLAAVGHYGGDLLPAGRPTDWLLTERDRLRIAVAGACERAAVLAGEAGDHAEVARLAERGLEIDRFRDGLWRLLVGAHQRAGQPAAAARAEDRYQAMLAELGITADG